MVTGLRRSASCRAPDVQFLCKLASVQALSRYYEVSVVSPLAPASVDSLGDSLEKRPSSCTSTRASFRIYTVPPNPPLPRFRFPSVSPRSFRFSPASTFRRSLLLSLSLPVKRFSPRVGSFIQLRIVQSELRSCLNQLVRAPLFRLTSSTTSTDTNTRFLFFFFFCPAVSSDTRGERTRAYMLASPPFSLQPIPRAVN